MNILVRLVCVGILAGCTSASIKPVSEQKINQLILGKSTKSDIVSALGLPNHVVKDKESGGELWRYSSQAISANFMVMVPVVVAPVPLFLDVGKKGVVDTSAIGVTCHIDKNGVLVNVERGEAK